MAHKNNFDFLRLIAALMVLFAHQFALLGRQAPAVGGRFEPGAIAMYTFFSISGYLVAQSWMSDPHVWRFMARRALRIWPALLLTTVVCAFVLGPVVTTLPASAFFASPDTYKYLSWLRLRSSFDLPGVFANLPFPRAVNGSLWSIPLEVHWYLILLLLALVGLMRYRWLIVAITFCFAVYHFGIYHAETNKPQWTNEYGLYFCTGACLYLLRDLWVDRRLLIAASASTFSIVLASIGHQSIAAWVAWPVIIVALGTSSTPVLRRFGRFGDLSYGAYVFAFPVQQTLVWATSAKWSVVQCLSIVIPVTLALAFVSWHFVEKPALRLKPRSRQQAPASPLATLAEPLAWLRPNLPTVLARVFVSRRSLHRRKATRWK